MKCPPTVTTSYRIGYEFIVINGRPELDENQRRLLPGGIKPVTSCAEIYVPTTRARCPIGIPNEIVHYIAYLGLFFSARILLFFSAHGCKPPGDNNYRHTGRVQYSRNGTRTEQKLISPVRSVWNVK